MSTQKQLLSVTSLQVNLSTHFPLSLIIEVTGDAPAAGFTYIHLEPYFYTASPENGVYEFSLTGIEPEIDEIVEEITAVQAMSYQWEDFPEDLKGIRVHADQNSAEWMLFEEVVEAAGLY